ncbi:sensor histidine kinase [Dyella telluris]|uniref:Histidine kinase/HSP90-like ATPase domain-containing protein n=1 Tax=Dyella telluris TaxID=2763498 RepID=A0A7G8Q3S4_9GAMM|nr:sensor histidine kinase [Dyella telluris]QNK01432.1 hypothetical protein H8F01_20735 [Dyella telluris]
MARFSDWALLSGGRAFACWLLGLTLALGLLPGINRPAHAVEPGRLLTQYAHTAWRLQDGELPAPAYPFGQTADGYLWVGTQAGPVRFDGARFVPLDALTDSRLANPFVTALLGARDGSLWIGTAAGLSRWKDGQLTRYPGADGGVFSLAQDQDGAIWLLTGGDKPLCEVAGASVLCHGKEDGLEVSGICCDRMVTDHRGTFWMGTDTAVVRWRPHTPSRSFPLEAKARSGTPGVLILAPEPNGDLWVGLPMPGAGLGLQQLVNDRWTSFALPGIDGSSLSVQAMLRDRHGALWVGTIDHGIYRIADGRVDHFDSKDGLTSDSIYSFFEDSEGNMWVATSAGIDRFRDFKVWSYSTREGLAVDEVDSVMAGRDGKVWIGTANSLDVLDHGRVQSLRAGKELPGTQVAAMLEDSQGRLWLGIDKGLWIYDAGKFTSVPGKDGKPVDGLVFTLAQDIDGDIWASVRSHPRKLLRIRDGRVVDERDVQASPPIRAIAADPRGGVWMGLSSGDLVHSGADGEKIATHMGRAVEGMVVADDGLLIAGSGKGVAVIRGSAQRVLSTKDGLPCDAVSGLVSGEGGALWLYMGCGLARVEIADLERALRDPSHRVSAQLFDVLDGVRPAYAPFQKAARAPDGTLWFADGVVLQSFDPHAESTQAGPLPIHIEQLVADRKPYALSGDIRLPALTRNVQFDYTAIGLAVPQRLRFRYRLDGRDRDWMDAGARRQAFYTDLPPGTYHFRVAASRGDGRWVEAAAGVSFTVLPAFYQTSWFVLLVVVVVALLIWLLFLWRLAQVKVQMRALFDERHAERERIARELHDTFLQAVQGLMLRFQSAMERIPPTQPARELMERALDHADEVIIEGRDRVTQLRASQWQEIDLPEALQQLGEELARDSRVTFSLTIEGTPRLLDPAASDEVRRIAQEGLANAFRHAQATHIDVNLSYGRKHLVLSIVDDGLGFDVDDMIENGPAGHWGLKGMHERAVNLHARFTVSSRAGAGSAIELSVPASMAFHRATGRWRRPLDILRLLFVTHGSSVRKFRDDEE